MKIKISKIRNKVFNKQTLIVALAFVVVVAGMINWSIRGNDGIISTSTKNINQHDAINEDDIYGESIETDAESDFFTEQRIKNEASKAQELEINKEILDNENSSEEYKLKAEQEIARIAKSIESENTSESLIKAKGYKDALVVVGADVVTTIIKTEKLTAEDVAVIKDIIVGQTGYTADKIKISEMK